MLDIMAGGNVVKRFIRSLYALIPCLLSYPLCTALSDHKVILALCTGWNSTGCPLQVPPNAIQNFVEKSHQTICKADISLLVRQIDWQSVSGGTGSITSMKVNNHEMLSTVIYPSTAFFTPVFPLCEQFYSCIPPYGNVLPGVAPKKSIIELANSNKITLDVTFSWSGTHIQRPVCSLNGVSYSAIAQLDFYYEIQENSLCPGWNPLTQVSCSGHGNCSCAGTDGLARQCICKTGYASADCSTCDPNYYGKNCEKKCDSCVNGGSCNSGKGGDGQCKCLPGFDPKTRCATCLPLFYGSKCSPCPNCNFPRGNCVDGINGNGRCSCAVGWDDSRNCADCSPNFFGHECSPCISCNGGTCRNGIVGDGSCICPNGFDNENRCSECLKDYYGVNCTQCESCNNHGTCKDGKHGSGSCHCNKGYTKHSRCASCSQGWDYNKEIGQCQCSPEHFGPNCLSCPICAPHGRCNSGVLGDGTCICDIGWSDSNNCVGCMSGYYGPTCLQCKSCGHGRCDDDLLGTGECNCHHGWDRSTDCYDCLPGYFGSNCVECPNDCGRGNCSSGIKGTGKCTCERGWDASTSRPCTTCLAGHMGKNCAPCPGYLESGISCSGHGTCRVTNGTIVECKCEARYNGENCESYEFPIAMVGILGGIALSTLGLCMCTMRTLASHARRSNNGMNHHPFGMHGAGFNKSEYVEISEMSDLELFVSADSRDWLIPFQSLTLLHEVGNGTSGQVFRSLYHTGGGSSIVAVKRLYSPVTGQEYFQNFFRREVNILSRLHHPNVVRFYGVSYYSRVLYIVTDFCPTSLDDLINNPSAKGPFEESYFLKIITQITSGMGFLHSRNVVHRDLKPANVLLTETDDVNICDFGLSRLIDPDMTSMTAEVGTPSYMAPEMATMGGIQCSTKGDVYSFGILLYSMWTRSKPYGDQGMNPFQLMTAVVNGLRPVISMNFPPGLGGLMRACWDANPASRPTFPEISLQLKDEWLLRIPDETGYNAPRKKIDQQHPSTSINTTVSTHSQAHLKRKSIDGSYADIKLAPLIAVTPSSIMTATTSTATTVANNSTCTSISSATSSTAPSYGACDNGSNTSESDTQFSVNADGEMASNSNV